MEAEKLSCVDCGALHCDKKDTAYPAFCLTAELPAKTLEAVCARYQEPENQRLAQAAALVEYEGYCRLTRVEETMEFARKIGAKKLGIATCIGLVRESRTLAKILRAHGFTVYGAVCKVGAVKKTDLGVDPVCTKVGETACNPILQAELLNEESTELNILVGLCVGHDSLFYKYSQAPVTTLVVKDRVLGHNPAAALYTAESYYDKLLEEK